MSNIKPRSKPYGNKNFCGANVERLRTEKGIKQHELVSRMQTMGVDINPSSLSKLEGQHRIASDIEVYVLAKIFGVSIEELISFDDAK